jgi:Dolichyl-phosphate-mannose-protein mannosyltransferase
MDVRSRVHHAVRVVAVCGLLTAAIVASMSGAGAFQTEFADHSDEPGHFVSGTLVHDYLALGLGSSPVDFAERYYAFYPKVAIGHWPPVFYAVQSVWFLIFGVGGGQAMALQATVFVVLMGLFVAVGQRIIGLTSALIVCCLLILTPIVQLTLVRFLADGLVALLMFGCLLGLGSYLTTGRSRDLAASTVFAIAAALTKGNALSLALVAPLALVIAGHSDRLRERAPWVAGIVAASVTTLWYLPTFDLVRSGIVDGTVSSMGKLDVLKLNLLNVAHSLGPAGTAFLIAGAITVARRRGTAQPLSSAALGYVIGWLLFHIIVPTSGEPNYLASLLVPAGLLVCEGIAWLARKSAHASSRAIVLSLVCLASFAVTAFKPPPAAAHGYSDVWNGVPRDARLRVILVASDERGEGALVAQARLKGALWRTVTLRGTKVLSDSDWVGRGYKTAWATAADMSAYLEHAGVDYVIMDPSGAHYPHYGQLEQFIDSNAHRFSLLNEHTVSRGPQRWLVRVYRFRHAREQDPVRVRLMLHGMSSPIELEVPR